MEQANMKYIVDGNDDGDDKECDQEDANKNKKDSDPEATINEDGRKCLETGVPTGNREKLKTKKKTKQKNISYTR